MLYLKGKIVGRKKIVLISTEIRLFKVLINLAGLYILYFHGL